MMFCLRVYVSYSILYWNPSILNLSYGGLVLRPVLVLLILIKSLVIPRVDRKNCRDLCKLSRTVLGSLYNFLAYLSQFQEVDHFCNGGDIYIFEQQISKCSNIIGCNECISICMTFCLQFVVADEFLNRLQKKIKIKRK